MDAILTGNSESHRNRRSPPTQLATHPSPAHAAGVSPAKQPHRFAILIESLAMLAQATGGYTG